MTLDKGWLVWVFKVVVEVNQVLQSRWKWGSQNLFMKKWHVDFDVRTTLVDILPIWVHILTSSSCFMVKGGIFNNRECSRLIL
jgi:hypothetical protein